MSRSARKRVAGIVMSRAVKRGAIVGLGVGLLALGSVLALAGQCLPYRISYPPPPWPWYCADPAYGLISSLTFPAPLLTNDLARALLFAPLSLVIYVVVGMIIGSAIDVVRSQRHGRSK